MLSSVDGHPGRDPSEKHASEAMPAFREWIPKSLDSLKDSLTAAKAAQGHVELLARKLDLMIRELEGANFLESMVLKSSRLALEKAECDKLSTEAISKIETCKKNLLLTSRKDDAKETVNVSSPQVSSISPPVVDQISAPLSNHSPDLESGPRLQVNGRTGMNFLHQIYSGQDRLISPQTEKSSSDFFRKGKPMIRLNKAISPSGQENIDSRVLFAAKKIFSDGNYTPSNLNSNSNSNPNPEGEKNFLEVISAQGFFASGEENFMDKKDSSIEEQFEKSGTSLVDHTYYKKYTGEVTLDKNTNGSLSGRFSEMGSDTPKTNKCAEDCFSDKMTSEFMTHCGSERSTEVSRGETVSTEKFSEKYLLPASYSVKSTETSRMQTNTNSQTCISGQPISKYVFDNESFSMQVSLTYKEEKLLSVLKDVEIDSLIKNQMQNYHPDLNSGQGQSTYSLFNATEPAPTSGNPQMLRIMENQSQRSENSFLNDFSTSPSCELQHSNSKSKNAALPQENFDSNSKFGLTKNQDQDWNQSPTIPIMTAAKDDNEFISKLREFLELSESGFRNNELLSQYERKLFFSKYFLERGIQIEKINTNVILKYLNAIQSIKNDEKEEEKRDNVRNHEYSGPLPHQNSLDKRSERALSADYSHPTSDNFVVSGHSLGDHHILGHSSSLNSADNSREIQNQDSSQKVLEEITEQNKDSKKTRTFKRLRNGRKVIFTQTLDDGWNWRKYGQKETLNNKHPRSYYRCKEKCGAKRQVEKCNDNANLFRVIYEGEHNHSPPVIRTSNFPLNPTLYAVPPSIPTSSLISPPLPALASNNAITQSQNLNHQDPTITPLLPIPISFISQPQPQPQLPNDMNERTFIHENESVNHLVHHHSRPHHSLLNSTSPLPATSVVEPFSSGIHSFGFSSPQASDPILATRTRNLSVNDAEGNSKEDGGGIKHGLTNQENSNEAYVGHAGIGGRSEERNGFRTEESHTFVNSSIPGIKEVELRNGEGISLRRDLLSQVSESRTLVTESSVVSDSKREEGSESWKFDFFARQDPTSQPQNDAAKFSSFDSFVSEFQSSGAQMPNQQAMVKGNAAFNYEDLTDGTDRVRKRKRLGEIEFKDIFSPLTHDEFNTADNLEGTREEVKDLSKAGLEKEGNSEKGKKHMGAEHMMESSNVFTDEQKFKLFRLLSQHGSEKPGVQDLNDSIQPGMTESNSMDWNSKSSFEVQDPEKGDTLKESKDDCTPTLDVEASASASAAENARDDVDDQNQVKHTEEETGWNVEDDKNLQSNHPVDEKLKQGAEEAKEEQSLNVAADNGTPNLQTADVIDAKSKGETNEEGKKEEGDTTEKGKPKEEDEFPSIIAIRRPFHLGPEGIEDKLSPTYMGCLNSPMMQFSPFPSRFGNLS